MAKELYVGSLPYDTTEYELEKLFSVSGRVTSIHLITDTQTGRFMGCGYVRMSTEAEAKDAIATLDGVLFLTKTITVSMANPQKQKNQGGGYKGKAGGAKMGGAPKRAGAPKAGGSKAGGSAARSAAGAKPAGKATGAKPSAARPAAKRPASKPTSKKP
ncbi:RNA-binding protein [Geomonas sp.]|uniref:RNA recognition motif domain-containing protein n=1 Tax=Geomonas sp. TaxID=2651584 RepID=UPI002B462318|nr:RNA-binding protein [Geomonas sp.]HJV34299.1 RNA-binding protein [Geomonas sp.]